MKVFRNEFLLIEPGNAKFSNQIRVSHPITKVEKVVQFTQPFFVGKYEVPQNLWREVMGSNPSRWKGERNSVEMITFHQSIKFCQEITRLLKNHKLIEQHQIVRLPTEIEWEYVASAGTKTKYSFGDDGKELGNYAWFTENAKGNDPPVGAKKPNPWGLYDVHGYLWEWCLDSWSSEKPLVHLKPGVLLPDIRMPKPILKSGSWKDAAIKLETRSRLKMGADTRDDAVGIRCLLTAE
ncbi:MAG: formylglycine-generating enzyme family protein [Planctomycetota bacterium]|nr:formylglycine-generating enzyme family protein [Planctomycetota bacterium]